MFYFVNIAHDGLFVNTLTEVIEPQLEKGLVGTRRTSVQFIS